MPSVLATSTRCDDVDGHALPSAPPRRWRTWEHSLGASRPAVPLDTTLLCSDPSPDDGDASGVGGTAVPLSLYPGWCGFVSAWHVRASFQSA